jgi:Fic family protein
MFALERYLASPSDLPPLVRAAVVHYHFEAVHPFRDGNGRVGRLLMTLMLCVDGLLPLPMLYISAFLERHRSEYYALLLEVSTRGEWRPWIEFILTAVIEESADAVDRIRELLRLRAQYIQLIQKTRAQATAIKLVDALFSDPLITARRTAAILDLSVAASQSHIDRLVDLGILRELTGGKRNRVYMAEAILKLLERESEVDRPE